MFGDGLLDLGVNSTAIILEDTCWEYAFKTGALSLVGARRPKCTSLRRILIKMAAFLHSFLENLIKANKTC